MFGDLKTRYKYMGIKNIVILSLIISLVSCREKATNNIFNSRPGKNEMADLNKYLVQKDRERIRNNIVSNSFPVFLNKILVKISHFILSWLSIKSVICHFLPARNKRYYKRQYNYIFDPHILISGFQISKHSPSEPEENKQWYYPEYQYTHLRKHSDDLHLKNRVKQIHLMGIALLNGMRAL